MTTTKPKVLLVDDEEDILEFLAYNLQKNDIDTVTAIDGKEALRKAVVESPDLIILDIMMPEMDGLEVCKKLREDNRFDDTAIAFLTARNEEYIQVSSLDIGGDDFIIKPIKPALFVSRVRALLRRSPRLQERSKEPKMVQVGDICLDQSRYVVRVEDKEIEMPKKEFQLLALLLSKPGKVFPRDQIFRKVWGNDVIVGNRTIDVHIRKVREKIGMDYIKTVKGVGYKFDI